MSPRGPFRIGIDASCLYRYGVGGMETYINNLIKELDGLPHPDLDIRRLEGPASLKHPSKSGAVNFIREVLWVHWELDREARRQGLHLLHMPAHLHAPWASTPQIATLHDAHVYIAPGTHPPLTALYIKVFTPMAGRKAAAIVTPSANAKEDLMKYHRIPAEKIIVTHLGSRRFPQPQGPHPHPEWKPYLFYLGVMKPHKNLLRLLEVFDRLVKEPAFSAYHLVLGGPYFGTDYAVLEERIPAMGLQDRVHLIGPQSDEQLAHWYSGATLAVLPSINEGFGHMPVEAMQFGTPAVVSKVGAIPEIVGHAAEFINDPTNSDNIYAVIRALLSNPGRQEELRKLGKARAEQFTWKRHAERMLDVYRSVLAKLYP